MRKWLRKHFAPHMLRPLIYKVFTRAVLSLLAVLLLRRYVRIDAQPMGLGTLFTVFGLVYALGAWLAYLRLSGFRLPRPHLNLRRRRDPLRTYGDISDHIDDDIIPFESLEPEEQDVCLIVCDLLLCAVSFLVSLFV